LIGKADTSHEDEMVEKLGLIAGNGCFPFMVLESARLQGVPMVVAAIREETSPEIEKSGYPVHWLGLGQLGKLIQVFKQAGVRKAMMAGQVKHNQIFGASIPDLTMIKMLASLKRKNTDSLIGGVAKVLERERIELVDSTALLEPHMAPEGLLNSRPLNSRESRDRDYGRPIAQRMASLDIGQTIVVCECAVVAVEAMEGTDSVIRRAGMLAGRPLTVIKVSKPEQDMRFDVPVVGRATVEIMARSGATALILDAHKTLLLERERLVQLANRERIAIEALPPLAART
jgi:DUF1009 family protein